jgi:hypothetical protein
MNLFVTRFGVVDDLEENPIIVIQRTGPDAS